MSWGSPPPLEDKDGGGGPGRRAALRFPRGVEDADMLPVESEGVRSVGSLGGGLEEAT